MDFRNDRYYCLLCALHPENDHNRFVTVGGVRIHLQNEADKNGHGIPDPQPKQHYVGGFAARQIFSRRQRRAEEEAEDLARFLGRSPNYTVEDFLVDFKPKAA